MSATNSISVTLGCDPQTIVTISETDTGTLFIIVASADPTMPVDLDGVFFNLSDDSTLDSLNFFPDANTGSIYSPVTSVQAAVNGVNTLANGAQVADSYDVGIQFGTVASSTGGVVNQANFTLFSDNGPMSLSDLDINSFATVVDSDGGNGQVLTSGDAVGADPVLVSKEVLFDNFNDIHTADQSSVVEGQTNWVAAWDKLVTNSDYEGVLALKTVSTDGPATLSFDANVHNTMLFENSGAMADSLRVEVSIDGGDWVLLDEFRVNDHGTAIVGSETGQTFGNSASNIMYEGGVLDTAEDTVQFRFVSDLTAADEFIKLDNVSVSVSEEVDGNVTTTLVENQISDDFNDIAYAEQSNVVDGHTNWVAAWDKLVTNSNYEGEMRFTEVATDGPVSLTMDLMTHNTAVFENSGAAADSFRVEVSIDGGDWVLLDNYQVNDYGTAIVGSETGQSFGNSLSTVNYSGGILDTAEESAQFRVVSDLTAPDEYIKIDNVNITSSEEVVSDAAGEEKVLLSENFDGVYDPAHSAAIESDAGWDVQHGALRTDGCNDGILKTATVQAEGDTSFSFDASTDCAAVFEATGYYADSMTLQVRTEDNTWQTLDNFVVNDQGTALVGSETGNEIGKDASTLTYSGGALDDVQGDLQFRFVSDISASDEVVRLDNFEITQKAASEVAPDDGKAGQYDVEYIAGIPVLQPVPEDQLKAEINVLDEAAEEDDLVI